jgi:hypothetical protein
MQKKLARAGKMTKLELALAGFVLVSSLILISCLVSLTKGPGNSPTTSALPRLKPALPGVLPEVTAPEASPLGGAGYALKSKHSRNSRKTGDAVALANEEAPSAATDFAETEVSTPLAFVDPSPDQVLTEEEVAKYDFLRREFVELLGGPNQDPSDPQYLSRWEYAQRRLDDEFRSFFGEEALNQQQLRAVAIAGQE